MINKRTLILLGVALLLSSTLVLSANATSLTEGDLSIGYAVVNNYDGVTVPMGANVVVDAMTTDARVNYVNFTWVNPADQAVFSEIVAVSSNGTTYAPNGKTIYYASSDYNPTAQGEWTVIVSFYDELHICYYVFYPTLDMRATTFNVIPEVPLLGTAGVSVAMLLGLGIFKVKRKQQQ